MSREIKKILISTMPRSGTVFIFNFISELFGYSKLNPKFTGGFRPHPPWWDPYAFDQTYLDLANGQVLCAHYNLNSELSAILDQEDTLGIYLYRDPRDVAVSSALYIKHGLPHHFLHKTFSEMSDADAIAFMLAGGIISANKFPNDMIALPQDYIEYEGISYFVENAYPWIDDQRVMKIRYEDFFSNPLILVDSANKCGVAIDHAGIQEVSSKWNFKIASQGRASGIEDKTSHFRKGVAGDYKNNFDTVHYALAKKFIGQGLIKLGYETSHAW